MKRLIFLLLLIPQICFSQTMVSNRDIKQHPATKLFISGNHLVSDFEDVSASNNQITKYADVKTVNESSATNPKYFPVGNDKGIYFDGTGDYISTTRLDSGDYTKTTSIELWYRPLTVTGIIALVQSGQAKNGAFLLSTNGTGLRIYKWTTDGAATAYIAAISSVLTINNWHHIVVEWEAGTTTSGKVNYYINGTKTAVSKTLDSRESTQVTTSYIGYCSGSGYSSLNGFVRNVVVSEGIARYSASFTRPELSSWPDHVPDAYTLLYVKGYNLAVNAVSFTDDSGTGKVLTTNGDTKVGYSRGVASYFDGTGDWITIPDSTDLEVGSDNFTFEFWFQNTRQIASSINYISGKYLADGNQRGYILSLAATDEHFQFDYSKTGADVYTMVTGPTTVGKWHHVCFVKNGTDILLFLDGILQETDTGVTSIFGGTALFSLGCISNNTLWAQGFCSNLRVSKGIARYTSNFTPPETEPIPDQYTKLLLKQKMLRIPDIVTNKTITVVGQTAVSKITNKNGKNNIVFDGTGDYLSLADTADFEITNNDFTVDFWVKPALVDTTARYILGKWLATGNQREWYFSFTTGKKIDFTYSTDGTATAQMLGTSDAVATTWYHVAMCKSSTNIYLFIDGDLKETDTGIASIFGGTSALQIGTANSVTATNILNGALSDIRITKGKALWTSNFTPPRRSGAY